ncbi:MAG: thioredoxin domain-containing protein [Clostridia bacterium]|nr:thioredoxin domain-containing protein [Clostridia bacterium]
MRPNRLAREASPYLRQHALNPVDWYPWGEEALSRARREDRPIFLSVGYAACHWCHVMARESFEDPALAELLNAHFVNVKVDREERPDLDAVYQTICQLVTGEGGWPLSVFLTPDLRPFFVGTYFPKEDARGRPGLRRIAATLAQAWKERRAEIEAVASRWTDAIRAVHGEGVAAPPRGARPIVGDGGAGAELGERELQDARKQALAGLVAAVDREAGGFGGAPKFPHPEAWRALLRAGAKPRELALESLRRMAEGGIHDQLGGGFHRYAVDREFRVPHFEKMLYDNAGLAIAYIEAHLLTGDAWCAEAARAALDWLLREMRTPEGGFAASLDADSPLPHPGSARPEPEREVEGAYYTWTADEIRRALGPGEDAEIALARFGVGGEGPLVEGRSVLYAAVSAEGIAQGFGLSPEESERRLSRLRAELLRARAARPRPARDEKVLAGWNGLAASAFARAYAAFGLRAYRDAAEATLRFVLDRLSDGRGGLLRRWAAGEAAHPGTLEDYAFVVSGLLDLHTYCRPEDAGWVVRAAALAREMMARFWDPMRGRFALSARDRADLVARPGAEADAGPPSPEAAAVVALLRLVPFTGDASFEEAARRAVAATVDRLARHPLGLASWIAAVEALLWGPLEVCLSVAPDARARRTARRWLRRVGREVEPALVATVVPPREEAARLAAPLTGRADGLPPIWEGRVEAGGTGPAGGVTAWVCRRFACSAPIRDGRALARELRGRALAAEGPD